MKRDFVYIPIVCILALLVVILHNGNSSLVDYYNNKTIECNALLDGMQEDCETNYQENIDLFAEQVTKMNDNYLDAYNEMTGYKNFTWTGCRNNEVIFTACKGCKSNLKCSGSMRPTLSCENTISFCKPERDEINIGDIIVFINQEKVNEYTVHRVVDIVKGGYITKGDSNADIDRYIIYYENIIGKLSKIEG